MSFLACFLAACSLSSVKSFHLRDDMKDWNKKKEQHPVVYGKSREYFYNDGRFYGWDAKHAENKGTVRDVKQPDGCFDNNIDSDDHCLQFTQTYDWPSYTGRYHSEVLLDNAAQLGMSGYYGMAFKLADNWEFAESYGYGPLVFNNRIAIAQFIANFRDMDCGVNDSGRPVKKGAVPSTMLWIQNDTLYIRLRFGSVCEDNRSNVREYKLGKVKPGQWHTIVFGAKWDKMKRGWFKVWFDKNLRVDDAGIKTFMDIDNRQFQFRVGMYPNWWTWDGEGHPFIQAGHQKVKELYIDSIGFGPTFEDADPWSVDGSEGVKDKTTD